MLLSLKMIRISDSAGPGLPTGSEYSSLVSWSDRVLLVGGSYGYSLGKIYQMVQEDYTWAEVGR